MSQGYFTSVDEAKLEASAGQLREITTSVSTALEKELAEHAYHATTSAMARIFGPTSGESEYTAEHIRTAHDAIKAAVNNAVHITIETLETATDGFKVTYRANDDRELSVHITDLSARYWEGVNS